MAIHLMCELIEARVVGTDAGVPAGLPRMPWDSPERLALRASRAPAA